jgi:hypothetical protein
MKLLNLDSGDEAAPPNKKKSKWLKIGIGVSALVLIPTIGSTLAGSISINAGSGVEFGQGVVSTAACDGAITVAPTSQLTSSFPTSPLGNGSMPGVAPYFSLGTISVSGIDGDTCDPVMFIIRAYNAYGGNTPLCSDSDPELMVYFDPGQFGGYVAQSCGSMNDSDTETDENVDGFFEWEPDLTDLYLDASGVNTITIESSSLLCSDYIWCD